VGAKYLSFLLRLSRSKKVVDLPTFLQAVRSSLLLLLIFLAPGFMHHHATFTILYCECFMLLFHVLHEALHKKMGHESDFQEKLKWVLFGEGFLLLYYDGLAHNLFFPFMPSLSWSMTFLLFFIRWEAAGCLMPVLLDMVLKLLIRKNTISFVPTKTASDKKPKPVKKSQVVELLLKAKSFFFPTKLIVKPKRK
jgi:hypothetical protein